MTPLTLAAAFVDVERDEARRRAVRELADPIYEDEPPLFQRILEWVLRQLDELLAGLSPLLGWGSLAVLVPIALIVAVVLWRFGPMARRAGHRGRPVFHAKKRSAAEYRSAADDAFAAHDWTASALERFRAIVAGLEERDVLAARAGRTADEAARDAGRLLPGVAGPLAAGAVTFDDVRYGERRATHDEAAVLRELEREVRSARVGDKPADARTAPATPR